MSSLQSILYEIRPCDLDSPYIFISYSSLDSELVWQDVREFQKRGYNVWLDEKNLDKTKTSWREDAIAAIEDMECELVVFYVSTNSLRSDACYQELSKTVDERTRALHFGPVKFVAVDAEPVGDITAFAQKVFREIRGSSLQKGERSRQALALDGFMRDFFNSNNEKVRIHPKNEANRKIDYYDDITASFPDSARVFEPEPESESEPEMKTMKAEAEPTEPSESGLDKKTAGKSQTEPEPAIFLERKNLASVHQDWDSKRLCAVSSTIVPEDKEGKKKALEEKNEGSSEEWDKVKCDEFLKTMKEDPGFTEELETAQEEITPEMDETAQEEITSEMAEADREEMASEKAEATRKTELVDDTTWFTKSEGSVPVTRMWKTFGKKEMKSTPIRGGVLEIPDGYTEIQIKLGHSLYWGNREIQELILPDSLRELNTGEFQNCVNLKQARLPGYLRNVASEAFRGCTSLKEIVIPGNVTTMNHAAFQDCVSLEKVVLPEQIRKIDSHAFDGCSSLKELHLPDALTALGMHVFAGCSSLKEVRLPSRLEKMDICCFMGCASLETVHIPGSLKRICSSAFKNCSSLRNVTIEEGVERIEGSFDRCGTDKMHIYIPDSVTVIDSIAFYKTTPVIHCHAGSYAENYAKKNSYLCVLE